MLADEPLSHKPGEIAVVKWEYDLTQGGRENDAFANSWPGFEFVWRTWLGVSHSGAIDQGRPGR